MAALFWLVLISLQVNNISYQPILAGAFFLSKLLGSPWVEFPYSTLSRDSWFLLSFRRKDEEGRVRL